jgi:hypothetical protein
MKKILCCLILGMLTSVCFSQQRETFDMATFIPPAGWPKEAKDFAVSFVTTNNQTQGWCRVTIYKSIASSGNSVTDFNTEWNALIAKNYPDAALPTPEATTEDGWTSQSGVAKFQYNDQYAFGLLTTVSGYEKEVSIVVLMNQEEFMPAVERFLASIDLIKPAVVTNKPVAPMKPTQSAQPTSGSSGAGGISISTTNFDDGWVAQPFADWVRIVSGTTEVYIYYTDDFSLKYSGQVEPENHYWSSLIAQRFDVVNEARWVETTYPPIYYKEGDAVSKETGKSCFIAMDVFFTNGGAQVILAVSPSKDALKQKFQHPRDLEKMLVYNKFAVTEKDLVGVWEESTGTGIDMYNSVTGSYAGMSTTAAANKFTFKTAGDYESTHKGAFGMVGSMKFYDQKYNGKYTVTNWDVTMTKRFEGKTDVFWAQFQAVKGGSVLHITNKTYSGISYHLVKTN